MPASGTIRLSQPIESVTKSGNLTSFGPLRVPTLDALTLGERFPPRIGRALGLCEGAGTTGLFVMVDMSSTIIGAETPEIIGAFDGGA